MEMLDKEPRIIGEVVYAEALYLKTQLESLNAVVEIHAQSAERLSYESEYEAICHRMVVLKCLQQETGQFSSTLTKNKRCLLAAF